MGVMAIDLNSFFQIPSGAASSFWDVCMNIIYSLLGTTPAQYSADTYEVVVKSFYPFALGLGTTMLNIFFVVGMIRQSSNIKENMTTEMWIELAIKMVIANFIMLNGLTIMNDFFDIASLLSQIFMGSSKITIFNDEADASAALFYVAFGLVYIGCSIFCGISILLVVLQRFLELYLCMIAAPFALSTWAGGRGIENTSYAWIKSFLASCFQIVVIAIVLRLGSFMMKSTSFFSWDGSVIGFLDGQYKALISMVEMFFLRMAVKNSYGWLEKTFNLR